MSSKKNCEMIFGKFIVFFTLILFCSAEVGFSQNEIETNSAPIVSRDDNLIREQSKFFCGNAVWDWSFVPGGNQFDSLQGKIELALNQNDIPYIFNAHATVPYFVRFATLENGCWRFRFLDLDPIGFNFSAVGFGVDSKNGVHASYAKRGHNRDNEIDYFYYNGRDNTGRIFGQKYFRTTDSSLVINKADQPFIFFNTVEDVGKIKVASIRSGTGGYEFTDVIKNDSSVSAFQISAAIDSRDIIHLAAYNNSNQIQYITGTVNNWKNEIISQDTATGTPPQIAVDENRVPHVAYKKNLSKNLIYVVKSAGGWQAETVAQTPENSLFSFAVTQKGMPILLCLSEDAKSVRLLTKQNGRWREEKLFDVKEINHTTSLDVAVGRDGRIRVAVVFYTSAGSADIIYGTRKLL